MHCEEAERLIAARPRADRPELDAHLQTCAACALFAAQDRGKLAIREPEPNGNDRLNGVYDRVTAALARERGPRAWLRSLPTPVRIVVAILPSVVVPLAFALARPRIDLTVYPAWRLVGVTIFLLLLIAFALWSRLRPVYRAPVSTGSLAALTAIAWIAVAMDANAPAAHAALPASLEGGGADLWARALGCFLTGTGIAIPAAVLIGLMDRRNDQRWLSILLLPLLGGLAGYLALHLHCHLVAPAHLVAGHLTVVLALFGTASCALAARARLVSRRA